MKRFLLASALALITLPALADVAGRWTQDGDCIEDPGHIVLTPRNEEGWEHGCNFVRVERHSPNSWTVAAKCEGEGIANMQRMTLTVIGGKLHYTTTYYRFLHDDNGDTTQPTGIEAPKLPQTVIYKQCSAQRGTKTKF